MAGGSGLEPVDPSTAAPDMSTLRLIKVMEGCDWLIKVIEDCDWLIKVMPGCD